MWCGSFPADRLGPTTRARRPVAALKMRPRSNHLLRTTLSRGCRLLCALLALASGIVAAADPYAFGDIRLGASFDELARLLDFRDIQAALDKQLAAKAAKPDLGRRGYGCVRRADMYADVTCVSHDETIGGAPAREIRLQFLNGILQQFSISAEIGESEKVLAALRGQYGAAHEVRSARAGAFASRHWRNADSTIAAYSGNDLVFVSFELADYAQAVKRRQRGAVSTPP